MNFSQALLCLVSVTNPPQDTAQDFGRPCTSGVIGPQVAAAKSLPNKFDFDFHLRDLGSNTEGHATIAASGWIL